MDKNTKTNEENTIPRNSYPIRSRLAMMLVPVMALAGGCTTLSPQGEQLLQGITVGAVSSGANGYASQKGKIKAGPDKLEINGGYQPQAQASKLDYVKVRGGKEIYGTIISKNGSMLAIVEQSTGESFGYEIKDLLAIRDN